MDSNPPCPAAAELRRLLDGDLPEPEQSVLSRHLETCPRCQQRLQDLAAGGQSWEALAGHLNAGKAGSGEALKQAMDMLREIRLAMPTQDEISEREEIALDFLDPPVKPRQLGTFDHYEIIEVIGRGGMGIVFKALDPALRRIVALKVMAPQFAASPSARQRFLREARAAAAVCHEHVVTIHAVAEAKCLPYLVMQFVAGVSLQERLEKRGPLNLDEILRIGMQTAQGLAAAHAQGLVHRDIKPANILLENGVERVKITDFGLARAANDASITQSGVIVGTPQYMAPEQGRGETVDHRADLFSLGSVLYFTCTGQAPFQGESSLAVIRRVCDEPPPPIREINPNVPDWLADIIARLQAKEPNDRFPSASEVAELLNQHLLQLQRARSAPPLPAAEVEAVPVAGPEWVPDESRKSRSTTRFIVIGTMCLLACLGAAAYLFRFAFSDAASRTELSEQRLAELAPLREVMASRPGRERPEDSSADNAPIVPAPRLSESKVEVRLPEPFTQVRAGGGGRYLVFHLKRTKKLAIFDVAAVKVVKQIELPTEDVVYACGRDHLMIVLPDQRMIQRWDLRTFEREKTVPLADEGPVRGAVMGCSSRGPLLLWSGGKVSFFDIERMEFRLVEVKGKEIVAGTQWGLELRASADGQTFVAWTPKTTPMNYSLMHLDGHKATVVLSPDWQSHNEHWALPNADGSLVFRHAAGIYTGSMKPLTTRNDADPVLLPTEDARFFLRLRKQAKDRDQIAICATADRRTLLEIPNLEQVTGSLNYTQRGLVGGEPRIHYLPSAKVLLTLPESNDRVVVRPLDLFASLDREDKDYLFVLSAPRTRVRAGTTYDYLLDIRSRAGGVRCKVESGPEGMTVSPGGRIRWQVPPGSEGKTANVIITIRDTSGKEIQHSFEIVVE